MANDRLGQDELPLTHKFLSLMLGVRRAGVTESLARLEERKMIRAVRGKIRIANRGALQQLAAAFYGVPEAEYRRLVKST